MYQNISMLLNSSSDNKKMKELLNREFIFLGINFKHQIKNYEFLKQSLAVNIIKVVIEAK